MKYRLFLALCFAAALAIAPGTSFAQVEVGPGGVTVGPHHDRDAGHGRVHDVPVVRGNHDNDRGQTHGDAHAGPTVRIEGGHGGQSDDHSNDHRQDRH